MKIYYICLLAALPLLCYSYPAEDTEKAIVVEDSDHAESESSQIAKRSGGIGGGGIGGGGSFDIVQHIKSGLLSGVGRASASFASASSGGSGGGHGHNSLDFDPWTLKKSVLNTIFQAVKAITGGVTAIKGQLIKGSGYALSAGGKLVAASGDKVTDVGKAIVHSAQLVPAGHGGGHPLIGKLSGLSGASSSSGGHSSGGHSSGGHSETITTYEIPSGHASYGAPAKAPSYSSGGGHQYLPPGGFGGAPFTGHAAFEGSPSVSYLPSKYGISVEGPSFGYYGPLSPREVNSASKALKEIEHILPFTRDKTTSTFIQQKQHSPHSYEVEEQPSEPIPAFRKPIIETISKTQSITTAFEAPTFLPDDGENFILDSSSSSIPSFTYINSNSNNKNNNLNNDNNNVDDKITTTIYTNPYDVYRVVTHKNRFKDTGNDDSRNNNSISSSVITSPNTVRNLAPLIAAAAALRKNKNQSNFKINNFYPPKIYTAASQKVSYFVTAPPPNVLQTRSDNNFQFSSQRMPLNSQFSTKNFPFRQQSKPKLIGYPSGSNSGGMNIPNSQYNKIHNEWSHLRPLPSSSSPSPSPQYQRKLKSQESQKRKSSNFYQSKAYRIQDPVQFNKQMLY